MKLYRYIILVLIAISFSSCEQEILIPLNSAKPRLVIDASLYNGGACEVLLTMTQDYWDQNYPETVDGARITISDQTGASEELNSLGGGRYTSKMLGKIGNTYTLTVESEGQSYTATEYLPSPVKIINIRTYKLDTGGGVYIYPTIYFRDPKGVENYYYYVLELNGRRLEGLRYSNDKNSDGKLKEMVIFFDDVEEESDEGLRVDDRVWIQLQSIGKGAHDYFKSMSAPGGTPNSNPQSNFSGNVLGMFKTYSFHDMERTITAEDLQ